MNKIVGDILNIDENINNVEIISIDNDVITISMTADNELETDQIDRKVTDILDDAYPDVKVDVNTENKGDNNDNDKGNNDEIFIIIIVSWVVFVIILFVIGYIKRNTKYTADTVQTMTDIESDNIDIPRSIDEDNIEQFIDLKLDQQHLQMVSTSIAAHKNDDNVGMDNNDRSKSDDLFETQDQVTTKGGDGSDSEMLYKNDDKMGKTPYTKKGSFEQTIGVRRDQRETQHMTENGDV